MGKVIAICNQKGGVGKTTTTAAVGAVLAEKGYKTILLDCDDSGDPTLSEKIPAEKCERNTLTDLLLFKVLNRNIENEITQSIRTHGEGYDFIPADDNLPGITNAINSSNNQEKRLLLRAITDVLKETYDFVLIDAAPALNIMSLNVLGAADELIITSQPQGAAENGVIKLLKTALQIKNTINKNLRVGGLLITMVDTRTNYNKEIINKMLSAYQEAGMRVFKTQIPRSTVAESWVEHKKSVVSSAPGSKVAVAYRAFVEEYLSVK